MASIIQQKRFANERKMIDNEPLHYITEYPDDKDPLTWYFLIRGQKETSFHGGDFIGKIIHSKKSIQNNMVFGSDLIKFSE